MSIQNSIAINLGESFDHFPRAPIMEAVIDIRARATEAFEESTVRPHLETALEGYSFLSSEREFHHEISMEGGKPPSQKFQDAGWRGIRFQSKDEKYIAQFNRDGFVFSRLPPYGTWKQFSCEGLKLWEIFRQLAKPADIHRVGLRFINRIPLPPGAFQIEDYIRPAPAPPGNFDLPFVGYMHHDTLAVPGHPYAINVIQTIQPPHPLGNQGVALLLDIDVFTLQGVEQEGIIFSRRLEEMRWLKNKVFFGSITDKAKELFR